ncbi:hypothetical protein [uncultured Sulfitobacter sp.]|uniref:hypothetical protein n=1 Tax=uncultured Sulfitobacter sp. TaxID=191468 RepID=UPI00262695E5|nr:hypothetical protein [uncultured Sulfitobacter sp.]
MSDSDDQQNEEIANLINNNLKKVFADLEEDSMPGQILDLLSVLRAQDMEEKDKK